MELPDPPPPTSWIKTGHCCGKIRDSETGISRNYCAYWKCEPCMPIFLSTVMLFCFAIFSVAVLVRLPSTGLKIAAGLEVGTVLIIFFWAYLGAVCRDPGYLPFNWWTTKKSKYSWDELISGTAIRKEQFDYVQSVPHPPGCSFSRTSGRYIIRADHICGWIANWVGKRNHKHFVLFQFWGGITALSMFVWRWFPKTSLRDVNNTMWVLEIFAMLLEAVMCVALTCSSSSFACEVMDSQTRVQKYKNEAVPVVSKIDSIRKVCGNGPMVCWMCPVDAFPDEIELVPEDVPSYV